MPDYAYPYDMAENMRLYQAELPDPEVLEWIDRMAQYTQEKGVDLILITVPDGSKPENQGYYNAVFEHVKDAENVTCINYNLEMGGMHHLTADLAAQFTAMVGQDLSDMYDVTNKKGMEGYESWNDTVEVYDAEMKAFILNDITDWDLYMGALEDDNYCIYLEQMPWFVGNENWQIIQVDLADLGFANISDSQSLYMGIIDISDSQKNVERFNEEAPKIEGYDDGIYYSLSKEVITIDKTNYPCTAGIRIVVYDKCLKRVVDSVFLGSESMELCR